MTDEDVSAVHRMWRKGKRPVFSSEQHGEVLDTGGQPKDESDVRALNAHEFGAREFGVRVRKGKTNQGKPSPKPPPLPHPQLDNINEIPTIIAVEVLT